MASTLGRDIGPSSCQIDKSDNHDMMLRVAKVLISDAAYRELVAMPTVIAARMRGIFERLEAWPTVTGAKPLRHDLKGHYRIRTGKYRVVFRVEGDTVKVLRIDHREDVYEG